MPARDVFHGAVRNALVKAGWTITHDPLRLDFGQEDAYIDLGAERVFAAEREGERIAVEVKSFLEPSHVRALEIAVGQYVFYRSLLARAEPERSLFLAVPHEILTTALQTQMARFVIEDQHIGVFSFDPDREEIVEWKR